MSCNSEKQQIFSMERNINCWTSVHVQKGLYNKRDLCTISISADMTQYKLLPCSMHIEPSWKRKKLGVWLALCNILSETLITLLMPCNGNLVTVITE